MIQNARFHATAISLICIVIVALYLLIGPKPAPETDPSQVVNAISVRVGSATWGANCNPNIDLANAELQSKPLTKDARGNVQMPKLYKRVESNNVLATLKQKCANQAVCEFRTSSDALGVEPLDSCYKRLSLIYRCRELDAPIIKNFDQGQTVKLDCSSVADHAPAPAAS